MSAIERCRTVALGGHVARCEDCAHTVIAYNSCRNRHCPKCQGAAARDWLAAREAELLPVGYFHLVFTLPGPISAIAYQNKTAIYDLFTGMRKYARWFRPMRVSSSLAKSMSMKKRNCSARLLRCFSPSIGRSRSGWS
jgi:Transposase zinc-binding domain